MPDDECAGVALVVGCPGGVLLGVDRDVEAVTDELRRRGFDVDVRTGDHATREGILAGYDALIARARADQPAVFYFAGHGFCAHVETAPSILCQGIHAADRAATTADDFHGITSWELSIKQTELTRTTRNVTVILDCCFASQASRSLEEPEVPDAPQRGLRQLALPQPVERGFSAHLDALRAKYGADFVAVGARSNPHAVRVVACGQDECVTECFIDGVWHGALTAALLAVLREIGSTPVSWAVILASIQSWIGRWFPTQHPGIEGPVRRRLFSLDEDHGSEVVSISATGSGLQIAAGKISRVSVGDVYAVMPLGSRTYDADRAIGRLQVSAVSGTFANVVLLTPTDVEKTLLLPEGAVAVPIEKRAAPYGVQIDIPYDVWPAVTEAVAAKPVLRIAAADEASELPRLCITGGQITLEDGFGSLAPPAPYPDGLLGAVHTLANLAWACSLRALAGEHGVLASELELTWGTVDGGQLQAMAEHGCALSPGERVCVRVVRRTDRSLYVHVFEIGRRGTISLWTEYAHTGEVLSEDKPQCMVGGDARGAVIGFEIGTLEPVCDSAPRIAELVVVVTAAPTDLRALETIDPGDLRTLDPDGPPAGDLPKSSDTGLRSLDSQDGFLVTHLSIQLHAPTSTLVQRANSAVEARGL
jgi:hypothetical protein